MTQEEIFEKQRKEKLYRKHPELEFPTTLPAEVLKEFAKTDNSNVNITFIIPFRGLDRFTQLNKCINNLLGRYPFCEILLVEDSAARVIKSPIPGVRYIHVYNKRLFNKSKCFNVGFLAATNNIICGIDCDMLIPSNLIDLNLEYINQDKVVFPGKDIYYVFTETEIADLDKQKTWHHKTWLKDRSTTQFHGGIFICTKKAFAAVGGFDHRFEGYGSEDSSFYLRSTESKNAITSCNVNLIHIDHGYSDAEHQSIETNRRLLIIYSRISVDERIRDCKKHNIFNNQ